VISLKYRAELEDGLKRTKNLFDRALAAADLRDKVSRAYYACYHAMIMAIYLEQPYNRDTNASSHRIARETYVSLFSKTRAKKGQGIQIYRHKSVDINTEAEKWKRLRESADYDILTNHFEPLLLASTQDMLGNMLKFAEDHIDFVRSHLKENP